MQGTALIFDIETDHLLEKMTKAHCLCIWDPTINKVERYSSQNPELTIEKGVRKLQEAAMIVGHNIIGFDIPAIKKLFPWFHPKGRVIDTIVLTRLIYPELKQDDFGRREFPKPLIGSHSLKAWGTRIGVFKGDFKEKEENNFEVWTQEMEDYCEQDVIVTRQLFNMLRAKNYDQRAIDLEHDFASAIFRQEQYGFLFDYPAAERLVCILSQKRVAQREKLQKIFAATVQDMKSCVYEFEGKEYATKAEAIAVARVWATYNKSTIKAATAKIKEGAFKTKTIPFNPGSRDQVAARFIEKYGWKPTEYTAEGHVEINEQILSAMTYPEAGPMLEYFLVKQRLGQLAEGQTAWMKAIHPDQRIRGRVNTNGAVTGRCTHSKPNIAAVPKVGKPYGVECRSLFVVPKGSLLVGVDVSGLELRMLAHFMAKYDGGAYMKELLEGDIHTANMKAAGLDTRDQAKTFIYAFLYGAGADKLGTVTGKGAAEGNKIKEAFLKKTPALARLKDELDAVSMSRGYLIGLDGRHLPVRSPHLVLNTLLQSAGALVVKKATTIWDKQIQSSGKSDLIHLVAHIHDEVQIEVGNPDLAAQVGQSFVKAIKEAGEYFKTRCPLDGEYKIGINWAETH